MSNELYCLIAVFIVYTTCFMIAIGSKDKDKKIFSIILYGLSVLFIVGFYVALMNKEFIQNCIKGIFKKGA